MSEQMFSCGSAKTLREGDEIIETGGTIRQISSIQPNHHLPYSSVRPGVDVLFVDRSYVTLAPSQQIWRRPGVLKSEEPPTGVREPRRPVPKDDAPGAIIEATAVEVS